MAEKKVDYNDILCQAIDTIVSRKIESLDYDKTIVCKIVDDSDASNGHYVVNDGSISFDAYSEDTNYKTDESVYVTVPKGDFTQTKIIISKYTADNSQDPISYVSPLEQVYLVSDNLVTTDLINNSILANGRLKKIDGNSLTPPGFRRLIWEQDLTNSTDVSVQNNAVFDTIALKAKFKCGLGTSYRMKAGHYGIIVQIYSKPNNDSDAVQMTHYDLSTDEMFGNPYMFLSYISQQKKIDISNLGSILKINVYLYQSNDFLYRGDSDIEDTRVPTPLNYIEENFDPQNSATFGELDDSFNNIFVDDLEIYFGMDLTKVSDNTFTIYCNSSSTFSMTKAQNNTSYNNKTIMPVWFNKTEDGEYLGYSDGIYDFVDSETEPVGKAYTEDLYLKEAKRFERGAQISQTDLLDRGIPSVYELLQTYALGQDAKNILNKIYRKVSVDIGRDYQKLVSDLRQYQSASQKRITQTLYEDSEQGVIRNNGAYATCISNLTNWMADESNENSFVKKVEDILLLFGAAYTNGTAQTVSYSVNALTNISGNTGLTKNLADLKSEGTSYFTNVKVQTDSEIEAVWDVWKKSFDNDIKECEDLLANLKKIISAGSSAKPGDDIVSTLRAVRTKFINGNFDDYEEEHNEFLEAWSKRYCIYWYRYQESYFDENEQFMPRGWQRLTTYTNAGLPDGYTIGDDYNKYYEIRPVDPRVTISVGNASVKQEQIQAILIYDHQIYKSNILNFYNEDPVIDEETSDANKGLYIQLTDEVLKDDGTVDKPDTYNSKETYQLYGITNYLVNQAERYTRRKLRARYKGINKGDEYLRNDCVIYWYVPLNSTMLDVNHAELVAAGFSVYDPNYVRGQADVQAAIDAIDRSSMTQTQYTQAIKNIKDNFIGTHYPVPPAPYKNNYIEGYLMAYKDIQNDSDENFENSTMFTYQIKNYYVPTFTNNTIRCRIVKKRTYVYDAEQYFTFASYGTSGTDYSLSIVPATNKVAVTDNKALALKIGLYDHNGDLMETETSQITVSLKDTSYNDNQAQAPVIVGGTAPDIQAARLRPTTEYGWAVLKANASITIHYDENGKAIREDVKQTNNVNGTSSISIGTDTVEVQTHPDRTINLESYYPIPWSSGDYYIEGASTIVYDSLGSNPSYYPDPYVLYYMSGSQQNKPVANQRWAMKYYPVANSKKTSLVSSYLPAMKQTNGDYCLQVPNMYLDDNNYVACAVCYIGTSTTPAWVQPILIIKNRFSSPMMNDWDGSLTLDEKNGTILSSMVGAGKKENDNTFSGVLMGDVSATSEDAATGLGLYGYNHGEQSFGFKNDGTAFIGKAGKGRIKFDGNHGEIASSSYADAETEAERTGMMVDLDDGFIDMRGAYIINDQTQAWKDANGKGQSQNNNEINGYDNTTKYKASGSQVLISSTSPFVTIKSPEILYYPDAYRQAGFNTGTELRDAYRRFWDSVEYYKYNKGASESKSAIRTYLQEVYDIHNATYYTSTSITVGSAPDTFLNNINEQKSYGYFRVSANLKLSNLTGTTFWSKLSSKPSYTSGTENVIIAAGDYVYCYMYSVGGNIDINSENFRIQYIPAQQAVILNVMAYPSAVPAYVNGSKEALTKVYVEPYTVSTGVGTEYTLSGQINDLRDSIYNAITAMRNLTASLNDSQFNSYECIKFLQPDDYATAKILYCQSNKQSNTILKIGMDEYYMQTDNYQKGTAALNYANGAGLKFDLMKGSLDAYNFTLFAADPKEGSSIKLSSNGNPFFKIAYKGTGRNPNVTDAITLIEISKSKWLMQSQNWYNSGDMTGRTGTQFDLSQGKITSYNFDLRAYNNTTQYGGSYIMMSSTGNPFFRIHLVDNAYSFKIKVNGESDGGYTTINTTVDKNLINITTSHFVLQSKDYGTQYTIDLPNNQIGKLYRGVQWDLNNSKFTMYSGKIELKGFAVNGEIDDSNVAITEINDLGFMRLSSDDTDTPFNINSKFKIYWDGSFMAEAGKIGGWRVNNTSIWTLGTTSGGLPNDSSFRLSSVNFSRTIYNWSPTNLRIAIGAKFGVASDGTMYAKDGKFAGRIEATEGLIGGWEIDSDGLSKGSVTIYPTSISIGYTTLTTTGGTIGGWSIYQNSLKGGNAILNKDGSATFGKFTIATDGAIAINTDSFQVASDGTLTINNKTTMTLASGSSIVMGDGIELKDISGYGTVKCKRIICAGAGRIGSTVYDRSVGFDIYSFWSHINTVSKSEGSGNNSSSSSYHHVTDLGEFITDIEVSGGGSASGTFVSNIYSGYEAGAYNVQVGDNWIHYYRSSVSGGGGGTITPTKVHLYDHDFAHKVDIEGLIIGNQDPENDY